MRRTVPLLFACLLVASSALGQYQRPESRIFLAPQLSFVSPSGDFGDEPTNGPGYDGGQAETGFGLGLDLEFRSSPHLTLGGGIQYLRFGLDVAAYEDLEPAFDWSGSWSWISPHVYLKLIANPDREQQFYLRAGFASGTPEATVEAEYQGQSAEIDIEFESAAGYEVGVGLQTRIGFSSWMNFEIVHHSLLTDDDTVRVSAVGESMSGPSGMNVNWLEIKIGAQFGM